MTKSRNQLPIPLVVIGLMHMVLYTCSAYKIQFEPSGSPPAIEPVACTKLQYSLPLNRQTSVPVTAYILYDNGDRISERDAHTQALFDVKSLDVNKVSDPGYVDDWVDSGGQLCQWTAQHRNSISLQSPSFINRCEGTTTLRSFKADNGMLSVDGLMHFHNNTRSLPQNRRVYKFTVHLVDGSTVSAETNSFIIHRPADQFEITAQPDPSRVIAGEEFSIGVRVVDTDGQTLTDGLDSCLLAELQVIWSDRGQVFTVHSQTRFREQVRLRGAAEMKKGSNNYVIRQQMMKGVAVFTGIQLLDVTGLEGIQLNVTSFMQAFPFSRRPHDYSDVDAMVTTSVDGFPVFFQDPALPLSKAVVLTTAIRVTEQTAYSLKIVTETGIKAKQGANFPIEDPLVIQVCDNTGRRIYSGPDATLNISVSASHGTLSNDASFRAVEGQGIFPGSIITAAQNVVLTFAATSKITPRGMKFATTAFDVIAEVRLAHFADLTPSEGSDSLGPALDTMVNLAVEDINNRRIGLPGFYGRPLLIHSYDTKNDVQEAFKQYNTMKVEGQSEPRKKVRAVIGFGSNTLTRALQPVLSEDQIPQLATRDDLHEFGNKEIYPLFNRLNWEMGAAAHSVLLAAQSRGWTKIVVLRHIHYEVSKIFYEKAIHFGIELTEVLVPHLSRAQLNDEGSLSGVMRRVEDSGTRIVWVFCQAPQLWKILQEAVVSNVSPRDGYQWVTMEDVTWDLPVKDQGIVCAVQESICLALRGLHGFSSTYKLDGQRTPMREHVLSKLRELDPLLEPWTKQDQVFPAAMVQLALGYDAVLVYAHALNTLILAGRTISGPALAQSVRQVTVEGLTGSLTFNEKGNRPGYFGLIAVIDPQPLHQGVDVLTVTVIPRYFELDSDTSETQIEISAALQYPLSTLPDADIIYGSHNPYTLPNTTYRNKRSFNTTYGILTSSGEMLYMSPNIEKHQYYTKLEDSVAPFYCLAGCGGQQVDGYDINVYQTGDCVAMNKCKCDDGYYGDTCDNRAWIFPVKRSRLTIGGLIEDDCESGVCSYLAVLIGVPVLVFVLLLIGSAFFIHWYRRRRNLRCQLANTDWRVIWDTEVHTGSRAVPLSSEDDLLTRNTNNYVIWKGRRCYSQTYPCVSLDINDVSLRMEIVRLKQLHHKNLITFIGASLEWPHVAILTETCPKGSLEDVLARQNLKLGWDFKYSILKDICCGMEYLHRSSIKSHGRLKSSNCLIDNKWLCKISGFGVPSIRYAQQRKALPMSEESHSRASEMFWTAPELLQVAHTLEDIQSGTQTGDVYSFAIIMSEVISREVPYAREMLNLSADDIIQLVRDRSNHDAARALKRWLESGGDTTRQFRPLIDDSNLPEDYQARQELKKLCEQNWHQYPEHRLTFRQTLNKLNIIHPIRGELIENLVNMLEKYSSNLETLLADRSKELSQLRTKTDQLVSHMLPKKVVDDLQYGRSIEPENFDVVTIFFSDLVGFHMITKESTPIQVINLLDDIYTLFDTILDTYDVYKVETIGDAYMVASGVPVRNGDLHAGEIATLSLDLMVEMCSFKVRHMPGITLQLRVGIHSGPCVAGVLGLKVPHYCLFGETVNIASRMESNSMAQRIHVSDSTSYILSKLGGYQLERRGLLDFKGYGKMGTFWLNGKEGFAKQLP